MIVVFAGPTISHEEIAEKLDCVYLPPVSHGDVIKLMDDPPTAIGIIDGYFEGAPSVWHKEILYALDQGIHVLGASSMGALRAAELDDFGMQGVGQIYEWYRDGEIEDDDEVAVLHGPEEVDYTVASVPMVSVRASLAAACSEGVIDEAIRDALLITAKQTFYKKRSWRGLIEASRELANTATIEKLETWLADNAIDLKKQDAMALLETMKKRVKEFEQPFEADFHFEWTHVWDTAFHSLRKQDQQSAGLNDLERRILDEVRLDASTYMVLRNQALLAWLAGNAVDTEIELADTRKALTTFREANGLSTRAQLEAYMETAELDEPALTRVMENHARLEKVAMIANDALGALDQLMLDQLKLDGRYVSIKQNVQRKMESGVFTESAAERWGLLRPQLLHWYFSERCGVGVPDPVDKHLGVVGLDRKTFYALIGAEYLFLRDFGE